MSFINKKNQSRVEKNTLFHDHFVSQNSRNQGFLFFTLEKTRSNSLSSEARALKVQLAFATQKQGFRKNPFLKD